MTTMLDQSLHVSDFFSKEVSRLPFYGIGELSWRLDFSAFPRAQDGSTDWVLVALTGERAGVLVLPVPTVDVPPVVADPEVWKEILNLIASRVSHQIEVRTGAWCRITAPVIKSHTDSVVLTLGQGLAISLEVDFRLESGEAVRSVGWLQWSSREGVKNVERH